MNCLAVIRACLGALLVLASAAQAQTYPARPITILVPYGPGGVTDQLAREIGAQLQISMKQTVIVENKPGGGAQIAAGALKQAPADGYTLLLADFGPLALNPTLFSKLSYDPRKDMQAVTLLVNVPSLLVVPRNSPVNSVAELFQAIKTRGNMNYSSPGVGSGGHLFGAVVSKTLGTPLTHVAYKGSGPALMDVMGGQIDFMFDAITTSGAFAKSDKVKALAIGAGRRSAQFPQVPTLKELGYESMGAVSWFGVVAKAGTPDAIIDRLNTELIAAIREPSVAKKFDDMGLEIVTSTPKEFTAHIASEITRWGKVIRDANMTVD
jgi:tripartite-type tricarboxylate transporter receptor subunit TctC